MKILTVLGARPQFIKAAVVSRKFSGRDVEEVIVHTGQHYDHNMSAVFFEELDIPEPKYNLGISGGSHSKMTAEMMISLEEVMKKEAPDMVLLYGDTNSTLSGALVASKLGIHIAHVESGGRLGSRFNPEEINRVVTDSLSSLLLCSADSAMKFLEKEGKEKGAYMVGDPMYDAFLYYSEKIGDNVPENLVDLWGNVVEVPKEFYYLTCHREENTKSPKVLIEILDAMNELDAVSIYPVHPRNREVVKSIQVEKEYENILFVEPVGYLMSIYLVNHSKKVVTDSGGLQREAFFAKKQCVTIFEYVVWPETMYRDCNQLSKPNKVEILEKLNRDISFDFEVKSFGDGDSASKIVKHICDFKGE